MSKIESASDMERIAEKIRHMKAEAEAEAQAKAGGDTVVFQYNDQS